MRKAIISLISILAAYLLGYAAVWLIHGPAWACMLGGWMMVSLSRSGS